MSEYIKKSSIIGLAHKLAFGRVLTDREVEVVEMVVNSVSDDAQVDLVRCGECRYYGKQKESQKAVPVVRCKDCKYWNPYKSHHYKGHYCDVVTLFVQENEYCAWGKRKGGEDDGE